MNRLTRAIVCPPQTAALQDTVISRPGGLRRKDFAAALAVKARGLCPDRPFRAAKLIKMSDTLTGAMPSPSMA